MRRLAFDGSIPYPHRRDATCVDWPPRGMVEPQGKTAADVAREVADALEAHHLPYAIGGAIALGFYAPPRATVDVDVNVFVSPRRDLDRALSALRDVGFTPEREPRELAIQAREEGQFRGKVAGLRVDVFVPAIRYYRELERRRRSVVLFGRPLWILAPEDLVVLKMMFFRRKDVADVEAVLRDLGDELDLAWIRRKLVRLAGKEDERIGSWDQIRRDVESG